MEQALARRDLSGVRNVGFDETASKRGHDYVSVFVDLEPSKVIFATEGKDSSTLGRFKTFLEEHGGRGENIERMCCDMSQAFIKGAREHFPGAKLTFDKFHVREEGELLLKRWYFWATHSRLNAMVGAARTIKHHWDGVLQWFESRINNGILEGINSLIQACKARARGNRSNRSKENLIPMI